MGRGRAPCCEKVGLNKGAWTPEEDMRLMAHIQRHGHANWRALPKQAGLLRCGKSCRLRWINYLRPDIKRGNFTKEEEDTIIKLHGLLGNKWSKIASCLPGRTDNEIKNVWNTHLKKRLVADEQNPRTNKHEEPPGSPSASASMSCSGQIEGNGDNQAVIPNMISADQHEVSKQDHEPPSIEKIEIPIEPNLDMWDMLEDSFLYPPKINPNMEENQELTAWDLPLEECLISSISNGSKDACKNSSSSSSSNSSMPSEECLVSNKESSCFTSSIQDVSNDLNMAMVHHKNPGSLEEESNKEDESNWWLVNLEKELGLREASDIQQCVERGAVEMEWDQVPSYFQRGSTSPYPLELFDFFKCLDAL